MRLLQTIVLSLLIHIFLSWVSQFLPADYMQPADSVEVELVDPLKSQNENLKSKQIVRQNLVPESLKIEESEDPLKFLSEKTQRVKKQVRAALSGMTENRSGNSQQNKLQQKQNLSKDPRKPGGFQPFPKTQFNTSQDLAENSNQNEGFSTVGEELPNELPLGTFTALNTDRYLFYTFFKRVEELIRFRWESSIQRTIDVTPKSAFSHAVGRPWVTHIEIWLHPSGEFHSAHVMKESGIKGFDLASGQAFAQARFFPNPPKEMVGEDGLIHLKYSFAVHYDPKVLVRQE